MLMLLLAAAEVSAAASGGSRGERRVEIVARLQDEEAAFSLGAAESGGPEAPQRPGLLGRATLDWPQRWEVGAWVSGELAPLSLAPAVAISDTPHGMAARGAIAVEVDLGPMKLRVETGLQRIFAQELTLLDVSAGISLKL